MPSLREALVSPETKFRVSLGDADGVFLDVPSFGQGSRLQLNAQRGGNAGRIRLEVGNTRGTVSAELVAETGQARFPEGSYTVSVRSVSADGVDEGRHAALGRGPLVLRGRPAFDPLEPPDTRRVGNLVVKVAAWELGFDLIELEFVGPDLVLLPLHLAGVGAYWMADPSLPPDKSSLWWLTLRCGLGSVTSILGGLAPRMSGPGAVKVLEGCAAVSGGCSEVIEQYLCT